MRRFDIKDRLELLLCGFVIARMGLMRVILSYSFSVGRSAMGRDCQDLSYWKNVSSTISGFFGIPY